MDNLIEISGKDIAFHIANLEQLVFEVTDACNLQCKYCAYGDLYGGYDKRDNIYLSFHQAKMLIDYLYEIWEKNYTKGVSNPLTVNFYGGEPLLNMAFIKEVVEYIEQLPDVGKKFYFGMTTNGVLLDRYMDYLAKKEFRLLISLDGNKENQGYRIDKAGKNSFDVVLSNIELLRTKFPQYYERWVKFNAVLHNKNSVESIYNFIYGYLNKKPNITPLNNSGIKEDKKREFNDTYRNLQESFDEAINCMALDSRRENPRTRKLTEYIYFDSGNVFLNYNSLFYDKTEVAPVHKTGTCVPFSKKMYVTVRGKILQCEKIDHNFSLGYITDKKVILDFDEVARTQNELLKKVSGDCAGCGLLGHCTQCIYFISGLAIGKPKCKGTISKEEAKARLKDTIYYLRKNPDLYEVILRKTILRS